MTSHTRSAFTSVYPCTRRLRNPAIAAHGISGWRSLAAWESRLADLESVRSRYNVASRMSGSFSSAAGGVRTGGPDEVDGLGDVREGEDVARHAQSGRASASTRSRMAWWTSSARSTR